MQVYVGIGDSHVPAKPTWSVAIDHTCTKTKEQHELVTILEVSQVI